MLALQGDTLIAERALAHVSPESRVTAASWLLDVCILAWPITSLTVFKGSATQQAILGLSWLALILTCVDIVVTTDVRAEQDG
jgi:hypothetical protein